MAVLDYLYWIIAICFSYFAFLMLNRGYRLFLPSTIHAFTWLVASILMLAEVKGWISSKALPESKYIYVSPFILGMVIFSTIGFILAHLISARKVNYIQTNSPILLSGDQLNQFIQKFSWLPYSCLIVGIAMAFFLLSIGGFDNLANYRFIAVTVKRVGYAAIAQRFSGHLSILGSFFLMIVGYKQAISGIKLKETFKYIIMIAAINISIGGRVWIISTSLPYLTGFFLAQATRTDTVSIQQYRAKIVLIIIIFISLFSVVGILRSNNEYGKEENIFTKFLYYTDGPKMANMVLRQYPPDSFNLEYGKANFLQSWIESPMTKNFSKSIEYDIGLSVTVKSTIPTLYYDFGYWGGMIMWGVFCAIMELICLNIRNTNSFVGIFTFGTLAMIPYQSPIGSVFVLSIPVFEWLILIYIFRRKLFDFNY